jgi:hypothetical protein
LSPSLYAGKKAFFTTDAKDPEKVAEILRIADED